MEKPKYTPGPWVVNLDEDTGSDIFSALYPGRAILRAISYWAGSGPRKDEREANATLAAAAPDMVEAIRELMLAVGDQDDRASQFGENALRKAGLL